MPVKNRTKKIINNENIKIKNKNSEKEGITDSTPTTIRIVKSDKSSKNKKIYKSLPLKYINE